MSIGVVIPAAGQGKRMRSKKKKKYMELTSRPILAHTLSVFIENSKIDQIIVVVDPKEINFCKENIIDRYFSKEVKVVAGGKD